MRERVCDDCIFNGLKPGYAESLEFVRLHPEDADDASRLESYPDIRAALELPRPDCCVRLRELLPAPEPEYGIHKPLALCPEVGAIALLYGDVSLSDV